MHLTTALVEVRHNQYSVEVSVDDEGTFSTEVLGETYENPSFGGLLRDVRDGLIASRVEVPFVSTSGSRGVIRGYHAGQGKVLITWENGQKDTLSAYTSVFPSLSDEDAAEIIQAEADLTQAKQRLDAVNAKYAERKLDAGALLAQHLNERVEDRSLARYQTVDA